jgi:large conductance mechanosensitive channel
VIAYGQLLTDIVSFVFVAFAVFLIVKQANRLKREPPAAPARGCPYCALSIPLSATRCPHCTSQLA